MQIVSCDVCKKRVDDPISERTFFYIGSHSVCEACRDSVEYSIKPIVRNREPFSMDWYRKLLDDSYEKASQKGRA